MPMQRTKSQLQASVIYLECELADSKEKIQELEKIIEAQKEEIQGLKRKIPEEDVSEEIEQPESPILSPEKRQKQEQDGDETTDEGDPSCNLFCARCQDYHDNGICPEISNVETILDNMFHCE